MEKIRAWYGVHHAIGRLAPDASGRAFSLPRWKSRNASIEDRSSAVSGQNLSPRRSDRRSASLDR